MAEAASVPQVTVAWSQAVNREDRRAGQMTRRRNLVRLRDLQRQAEQERARQAHYCDPEDYMSRPAW